MKLNDAKMIKFNGIEAVRAVYNNVNIWVNDTDVDYPLVKSEYPSLIWVTYPGLFSKDNLENEYLSQGTVVRDSNGFTATGGSNVAYYPPFSPNMIELTETGEATLFIRVTPNESRPNEDLMLINTPRDNAMQTDKFRLYFNNQTLTLRNLTIDGNILIFQSANMGFSLQPDIPYMLAVSVNETETRFYVNGNLVGSPVSASGPNFAFTAGNIAFLALCSRGPHNGFNSWSYKNLDFCAVFNTALSASLISQITENPRILINNSPQFDTDALAWFNAVEAAGSTFVAGAKEAYNKFFTQVKADGNLAPFANGMLLSFAGFTGLAGCFVPLRSRGGVVPTNVNFVASNKATNWLQGTGSAYINCGIGLLVGQQNNHSMFAWGSTVASSGIFGDTGSSATGVSGSTSISERSPSPDDVFVRSSVGSLSGGNIRTTGLRLINRNNSAGFDYYGASEVKSTSFASTDLITANVTIFARDGSNPTNRRLQLAGFGDALPAPDAFRTACNTLMNDLGITI